MNVRGAFPPTSAPSTNPSTHSYEIDGARVTAVLQYLEPGLQKSSSHAPARRRDGRNQERINSRSDLRGDEGRSGARRVESDNEGELTGGESDLTESSERNESENGARLCPSPRHCATIWP
ncbi:hypothetical protein EVG20_g6017 [Dentipellis fragilis]|uniref:Uncharacterized protein n=1 Tax=Dentipellis fragilis TaxID=205917 RepID=A0A4Y9YP69_9AGAM|nr:hypothetical protein EVG20_g6017 [Dentipellis fragilis]